MKINARVNPMRCPTVPTTPFPHCEVVPISRTPADTEHRILKTRPTKMLTLHYVIRCIFENKCAGEPLRCPTVPTTPFPQCEVAPTSRTFADGNHTFHKKKHLQNRHFHHDKRCISTNECENKPLRCPTVPTTPSRPCEVVPTSRTLADTEHIISKHRLT